MYVSSELKYEVIESIWQQYGRFLNCNRKGSVAFLIACILLHLQILKLQLNCQYHHMQQPMSWLISALSSQVRTETCTFHTELYNRADVLKPLCRVLSRFIYTLYLFSAYKSISIFFLWVEPLTELSSCNVLCCRVSLILHINGHSSTPCCLISFIFLDVWAVWCLL